MKKIIWFTTCSVLFLVFILPGILTLAIHMIPINDQPGYDYNTRISIYGKNEITQKFISMTNNLTAIGTSIRNPNLKNQKSVVFNLYDKTNHLLRSVVLNGLNIEDGDFVKFAFEPVPDSLGKEYLFTLASPDAGPGESLEVFIIPTTETILEYTYGEETRPGGVPLVTFYKPRSKLAIWKAMYVNLFSRLVLGHSQIAE